MRTIKVVVHPLGIRVDGEWVPKVTSATVSYYKLLAMRFEFEAAAGVSEEMVERVKKVFGR